MLLVRIAEIRENSHVGTDHSFEPLHLARFRNAGFDNGKSFVPVEHQQRERYADLRVVAARAAKQFHTRWAELCDPLFGNRFAVAAGDGNDRTPESVAVVCGEALECGDGIGFFVGQCMKEMRGQGNPKLINELLAKKLG